MNEWKGKCAVKQKELGEANKRARIHKDSSHRTMRDFKSLKEEYQYVIDDYVDSGEKIKKLEEELAIERAKRQSLEAQIVAERECNKEMREWAEKEVMDLKVKCAREKQELEMKVQEEKSQNEVLMAQIAKLTSDLTNLRDTSLAALDKLEGQVEQWKCKASERGEWLTHVLEELSKGAKEADEMLQKAQKLAKKVNPFERKGAFELFFFLKETIKLEKRVTKFIGHAKKISDYFIF